MCKNQLDLTKTKPLLGNVWEAAIVNQGIAPLEFQWLDANQIKIVG